MKHKLYNALSRRFVEAVVGGFGSDICTILGADVLDGRGAPVTCDVHQH